LLTVPPCQAGDVSDIARSVVRAIAPHFADLFGLSCFSIRFGSASRGQLWNSFCYNASGSQGSKHNYQVSLKPTRSGPLCFFQLIQASACRAVSAPQVSTSGRILTTSVFSCPKCGRIYQATQKHVAEKRAGRVDCQNCGTVIHTWYGFFRYADWEAIE